MVMDTLQIRMTKGLLEQVDSLVEQGLYANRADVVRDAVRRLVWKQEAGSIPFKGSGVGLVRKARDNLSKESLDLGELNSL